MGDLMLLHFGNLRLHPSFLLSCFGVLGQQPFDNAIAGAIILFPSTFLTLDLLHHAMILLTLIDD
jgi:hypothetical protein